jgi:cobalt-zinc-cadmium resistance protein CzcA
MVRRLIEWAVHSPLIVIVLALALAGMGTYSFLNVNVEAYPDPAPAIIEVVAQYPGASAEEVERQVTIPLEITLAGMPGLKYTRSKSLFGLSHLRNQFDYGIDFYKARQEVINRLQFVSNLPAGVTPQISPETPTGEIFRYTLNSPKDALGRDIFTLNDLKALQDWTLERQFRRVPRITDITSSGGTIKRYEIHPDPERLKMYGITLQQLQNAIANSNTNAGGDYLFQGPVVLNVRGIGLLGGGQDPMQSKEVLGLQNEELKDYLRTARGISEAEAARLTKAFAGEKVKPPLTEAEQGRLVDIRRIVGARAATRAAAYLRAEENRRLREIRQIVVAVVNNVPVTVDQLVDAGPRLKISSESALASAGISAAAATGQNGSRPFEDDLGNQGVVVGHQTRLGKVSLSRPKRDDEGPEVHADAQGWIDADEKIQSIVLLRKNEDSLPALRDVKAKVEELNQPGRLLPGVQIEPYYDRTDLINVTTETVRENLILGMVLVIVILFMFLSNVRSAMIVAINIPLALLFAFSMLFLRGKSANLLSIGAVDFGIIVDSSVIMVENIYRHICAGESQELPLRERIIHASHEVERGLFFSTAIMVCAFIPLFTMQGPEGQIFGPMADTYAFALGGALLLALTVSPVLCLLFFKGLKPRDDNFLVRWLKTGYLRQLERCLNQRALTLGLFGVLLAVTFGLLFLPPWMLHGVGIGDGERPLLGREFMPELEEGNFWIRGTFPLNISMDEVANKVKIARSVIRQFPEVESIVTQVGRPDDGTDADGFYNSEFFVPLKPESQWPPTQENSGFLAWLGHPRRSRTKLELTQEMSDQLKTVLPGVNWNFSQNIRDNVMESLSGVKGDNSVKIIGPDLDELERLADQFKTVLGSIQGVEEVGVFRIKGQPNLEFPVDPEKCKFWGVLKTDVANVIQTAVGGKALTQMIEGERLFDITLRWPFRLRTDLQSILDIPIEVPNNSVTSGTTPSLGQTPLTGPAGGVSSIGTSQTLPSLPGNALFGANLNYLNNTPRRHLRDFVTPLDEAGRPNPAGQYIRPGASTIYREQGNRLIAIKFSVRNRDLASAVDEAQEKTKDLIQAPYRAEWSGEFQEMQDAERRLMFIIPLSLALIFGLLYLAFGSLWDVFAILSNVVALSMGGVWALLLTGTNFSISAAVGFISIFGVAIMDGLLLIAYFNQMRFRGKPLREAIMQGAEKRVRPVMMTALTAVFGLLPAALSTRIGAQTQRPLAIVVVGGMIMSLLLNRYLMPVLYSFYGHREPKGGSHMAH